MSVICALSSIKSCSYRDTHEEVNRKEGTTGADNYIASGLSADACIASTPGVLVEGGRWRRGEEDWKITERSHIWTSKARPGTRRVLGYHRRSLSGRRQRSFIISVLSHTCLRHLWDSAEKGDHPKAITHMNSVGVLGWRHTELEPPYEVLQAPFPSLCCFSTPQIFKKMLYSGFPVDKDQTVAFDLLANISRRSFRIRTFESIFHLS